MSSSGTGNLDVERLKLGKICVDCTTVNTLTIMCKVNFILS